VTSRIQLQVKENQAIFLKQCKSLPIQSKPLAETISHEKAHGAMARWQGPYCLGLGEYPYYTKISSIYDFKIEVVSLIINFSTELTT
jgi:hypothetical protein